MFSFFISQVETCQEKIISLELEDPKSLESPTTPTTEQFIQMQLQQRLNLSSVSEDSDDNQSVETVCQNPVEEDRLILRPSDIADYANANVFVKQTIGVSDKPNLQTIVEVVNPILGGDGTAQEIAIGRSNDCTFPSFDEHDSDEVVLRKKNFDGREMSINDKMKNVLKELQQNERVRLSLSRSLDDEDEDFTVEKMVVTEGGDQQDGSLPGPEESFESYEEKKGANGTVFMVRERLINDFFTHQSNDQIENGEKPDLVSHQTLTSHNFYKENIDFVDNCQIYENPNVEDFLENEIKFSEENSSLSANTKTIVETITTTTTIVTSSSTDSASSTVTQTETQTQIQSPTLQEIKERKEQLTLQLNEPDGNDNENEAGDDDPNIDDENTQSQDSMTPTTPTKSLIPTATNNKQRKKRKAKNKKK